MKNYAIPFAFLAEIFLGFCLLQVIMLPLGIIAGRIKSQNLMAVYIFMATLVVAGLGILGGIAIFVSGFILAAPANYQVIRLVNQRVRRCIYVR